MFCSRADLDDPQGDKNSNDEAENDQKTTLSPDVSYLLSHIRPPKAVAAEALADGERDGTHDGARNDTAASKDADFTVPVAAVPVVAAVREQPEVKQGASDAASQTQSVVNDNDNNVTTNHGKNVHDGTKNDPSSASPAHGDPSAVAGHIVQSESLPSPHLMPLVPDGDPASIDRLPPAESSSLSSSSSSSSVKTKTKATSAPAVDLPDHPPRPRMMAEPPVEDVNATRRYREALRKIQLDINVEQFVHNSRK